jgi:hypothetical protein
MTACTREVDFSFLLQLDPTFLTNRQKSSAWTEYTTPTSIWTATFVSTSWERIGSLFFHCKCIILTHSLSNMNSNARNSVMIGLQYLFLEPNASDPLNKDAAIALQRDREKFKKSVQLSMQGRSIGGVEFDNVISASSRRRWSKHPNLLVTLHVYPNEFIHHRQKTAKQR